MSNNKHYIQIIALLISLFISVYVTGCSGSPSKKPQNTVASTSPATSLESPAEQAARLLSEAKSAHDLRNFKSAIYTLKQIIELHSATTAASEANILLAKWETEYRDDKASQLLKQFNEALAANDMGLATRSYLALYADYPDTEATKGSLAVFIEKIGSKLPVFTADEITNKFVANKPALDQLHDSKFVIITGKVEKVISENTYDTLVISVTSSSLNAAPQCYFQNINQRNLAKAVKKGDVVNIIGLYAFSSENVRLNECTFNPDK